MELARAFGIGCVGHAQHQPLDAGGHIWEMAAKAGFALICWTNAVATIPPYGSRDVRLGNNPLVIAVPRPNGPLVLGHGDEPVLLWQKEVYRRRGESLPVPGGIDANGRPTNDAAVILESGRATPIGILEGFWPGAVA
jgi:3-dehydro-L-gulonate 2-dehydrogenase